MRHLEGCFLKCANEHGPWAERARRTPKQRAEVVHGTGCNVALFPYRGRQANRKWHGTMGCQRETGQILNRAIHGIYLWYFVPYLVTLFIY